MQTEVFCCSKYKQSKKLGDDTFIYIPNVVMGVFDGASDPLGTIIDNEPAGLVASRNVANICANYFLTTENRAKPKQNIMSEISNEFSKQLNKIDFKVRPSTTLAIILDLGDEYRLLILGDTKIRINGNQVIETNKRIDDVSAHARVMVFNILASRMDNLDAVEASTRRVIFTGLQAAIAENILSQSETSNIVNETILKTGFSETPDEITQFLMGGIQVQQGYSNNSDHPLGFASMNGYSPIMSDILDQKFKKSDVTSFEIYSDGYFALPVETNIKAWEQTHARVEAEDFHKTGQYATVKGSTSDEYSDDRTIFICKI